MSQLCYKIESLLWIYKIWHCGFVFHCNSHYSGELEKMTANRNRQRTRTECSNISLICISVLITDLNICVNKAGHCYVGKDFNLYWGFSEWQWQILLIYRYSSIGLFLTQISENWKSKHGHKLNTAWRTVSGSCKLSLMRRSNWSNNFAISQMEFFILCSVQQLRRNTVPLYWYCKITPKLVIVLVLLINWI